MKRWSKFVTNTHHFQQICLPLTSSLTLLESIPFLMALLATLVTEQLYSPASLRRRVVISSWDVFVVPPVLLMILLPSKHTVVFLPADLWVRNTSEGAYQFKPISLSMSCWLWQAYYLGVSCGEEKRDHW